MADKGKILIIEDEKGLVVSLEDRLASEGYSVTSRMNGILGEKEALDNRSYDLILLDIMLPDKDGFQICQTLRRAGIITPILILTARNTNIDTVLGLKLGADDYLAKPFDMQVLLARIEALLRRKTYANQYGEEEKHIYSFGRFQLNTEKRELYKGKTLIPLNAQEYRLMKYLLEHPEKTISRDELLNEVWEYDSVLTTRTVDVHIAWLRQKLGESEVPCHIRTIRGMGYKFLINP